MTKRAGAWRQGICACLLAVAALLAPPLQAAAPAVSAEALRSLLVPQQVLPGANVTVDVDPSGAPRFGAMVGFQPFTHPSAVAARGPDLYVFDAARRAIYRYDRIQQLMVRVLTTTAGARARLRIGADLSLYVLEFGAKSIRRYLRTGRLVNEIVDRDRLAWPLDFVVDDRRGLIYAADGALQQVMAFHALGRAGYRLYPTERSNEEGHTVSDLALGAEALFASDAACHCVAEILLDGSAVRSLGAEVLKQPGAIAIDDHGRLYVFDRFDAQLKVFRDGHLWLSIPAAMLGLAEIADMSIDASTLYVADPGTARIASFLIVPPRKSGE